MNNFTTISGACPVCQAPVSIVSDHGDGRDYNIEQRPLPVLVTLYLHGIKQTCRNCKYVLQYKTDFLGGMYITSEGEID